MVVGRHATSQTEVEPIAGGSYLIARLDSVAPVDRDGCQPAVGSTQTVGMVDDHVAGACHRSCEGDDARLDGADRLPRPRAELDAPIPWAVGARWRAVRVGDGSIDGWRPTRATRHDDSDECADQHDAPDRGAG